MFHLRYDHQTEKETRFIFGLPPGGLLEARYSRNYRSKSEKHQFASDDANSSHVKLYSWCSNCFDLYQLNLAFTGSNQAYRTISTSQLNALPRLHLWPIDEVVYLGPQGYLVLRGASRLDAFSGYPFQS